MAIDQQIQQTIEIYILEGLPPDEEDRLWIEFLKNKELYEYFLTELHLRALSKGWVN